MNKRYDAISREALFYQYTLQYRGQTNGRRSKRLKKKFLIQVCGSDKAIRVERFGVLVLKWAFQDQKVLFNNL